MSTPKLMIGLPIYGDIPSFFMDCILRLSESPRPYGIDLARNVGDSLVPRSRNTLTAQFLQSDCTHLLQIDCDLLFHPSQVDRLMLHPEPIVGGLYPKKQEGEIQWVINAKDLDNRRKPSGLQQVRYVGTGFCRVAREVFDAMIKAYPEIAFEPDHAPGTTQWDLWPAGVYHYNDGSKPRYLSEDWYFCQRAMDLGYQIWADTQVVLKHVGTQIFPNKAQEEALRRTPVDSPAKVV